MQLADCNRLARFNVTAFTGFSKMSVYKFPRSIDAKHRTHTRAREQPFASNRKMAQRSRSPRFHCFNRGSVSHFRGSAHFVCACACVRAVYCHPRLSNNIPSAVLAAKSKTNPPRNPRRRRGIFEMKPRSYLRAKSRRGKKNHVCGFNETGGEKDPCEARQVNMKRQHVSTSSLLASASFFSISREKKKSRILSRPRGHRFFSRHTLSFFLRPTCAFLVSVCVCVCVQKFSRLIIADAIGRIYGAVRFRRFLHSGFSHRRRFGGSEHKSPWNFVAQTYRPYERARANATLRHAR